MDGRLQAVVRARGQHRCVGACRAHALTLVLRVGGRDRKSASALWRNGVSRQPASAHLMCRTSGRRHSFNPSGPPAQTPQCPTGLPQRLPLWASQILAWPNQSRRDRPRRPPLRAKGRHRQRPRFPPFLSLSLLLSLIPSVTLALCLSDCLSPCSVLSCLSDAYCPPQQDKAKVKDEGCESFCDVLLTLCHSGAGGLCALVPLFVAVLR